MKFTAPADVSAITLSIGELAVIDGSVTVPDDANLSEGDKAGLAAYGFTLEVEPAKAPAKAKDA